jgi:hypothetical protein
LWKRHRQQQQEAWDVHVVVLVARNGFERANLLDVHHVDHVDMVAHVRRSTVAAVDVPKPATQDSYPEFAYLEGSLLHVDDFAAKETARHIFRVNGGFECTAAHSEWWLQRALHRCCERFELKSYAVTGFTRTSVAMFLCEGHGRTNEGHMHRRGCVYTLCQLQLALVVAQASEISTLLFQSGRNSQ